MSKPRLRPLTEQLRQIVLQSGKTRYRISKDTGIPEPSLSRFVRGEQFLAPESLDKLGAYLGLRIVADNREEQKKGK